MTISFICPVCKCELKAQRRLRRHLKKHTETIEKQLRKEMEAKLIADEKKKIEQNILKYGSRFRTDSERNAYFNKKRELNPLFDKGGELKNTPEFILSGGAFGLGKSRKN